MLSQNLLSSASGYRSGNLSLDQFEDEFQFFSRSMFAESPETREACVSIHNAFSELRYGLIAEDDFDRELAIAAHPIESRRIPDNLAVPK